MQTLRATQFFSGRLPSDEVITLHSGNDRAFEDTDAEYLLREFADRFEEVALFPEPEAKSQDDSEAAGSQPQDDLSLLTKPPVEVLPEVEKFGAQAEIKSKTKKGK